MSYEITKVAYISVSPLTWKDVCANIKKTREVGPVVGVPGNLFTTKPSLIVWMRCGEKKI